LREIIRLNLRQPSRTNFRHPRGFIERQISRAPRLLKFFFQTFDRHGINAG
jgi:hypothetical protein